MDVNNPMNEFTKLPLIVNRTVVLGMLVVPKVYVVQAGRPAPCQYHRRSPSYWQQEGKCWEAWGSLQEGMGRAWGGLQEGMGEAFLGGGEGRARGKLAQGGSGTPLNLSPTQVFSSPGPQCSWRRLKKSHCGGCSFTQGFNGLYPF